MSYYSDLLNETVFSGDTITVDSLTVNTSAAFPFVFGNSLLSVDANGNLLSIPLLDGQLLIGRTGSLPAAGYITGTTNQIAVTSGPGTIQLGTPQDIATTSSPTFSTITGSSLTPNFPIKTNSSRALVSSAINLTTDVALTLPVGSGGTGQSTALTNGQLWIGSTGNVPSISTLTAGTNMVVTNGAGSISLATSSAPTFESLLVASGTTTTTVTVQTTGGSSSWNHLDGTGCTLKDNVGG